MRIFYLFCHLSLFGWLFLTAENPVSAQNEGCSLLKRPRIEQLVEANLIATHAFQILLAKKSQGATAL